MAKRISRRTLLRGAGVAMALPWLEITSPAAEAGNTGRLTEPPLRMAFMFMPNGVRPEHWTPPGDGDDYEITPHLKPLAPSRTTFCCSRISGTRTRSAVTDTGPRSPSGYPAATSSAPPQMIWIPAPSPSISWPPRNSGILTPLPSHRTRSRVAAQRHRCRRRRIRAAVRFVHLLARPPHARPEGNRPAIGFRPTLPRKSLAGDLQR